METNPKKWREFSVSNSFCRTTSFVECWTQVRGMEQAEFLNNMDGLLTLYDYANIGDIILLYDKDDTIRHLCLLVVKNDMTLLVNANTKDYKDRNILDISPAAYPKLGVIHMK